MSNDNESAENVKFREHVTGLAFCLSVTKTQVAALDDIARGERDQSKVKFGRCYFITAVHGLIDRGLIEHRHKPDFLGRTGETGPITNFYRLTRAGWLTHDLLTEAGLVMPVTSRKLRKLVA